MSNKCRICGAELSKKNLDILQMLSKEEAERLYVVRKSSGLCSECSFQMLMLMMNVKG